MSTASIDSSTIFIAPPTPQNLSFFYITHLVIVKLANDNYLMWFHQMESFICGQNNFRFIDGSYLCPKDEPNKTIWLLVDKTLVGLISTPLSEFVLATVIGCTSSAESWSLIQEHYSQRSFANISFYKMRPPILLVATTLLLNIFKKLSVIPMHWLLLANLFPTKN